MARFVNVFSAFQTETNSSWFCGRVGPDGSSARCLWLYPFWAIRFPQRSNTKVLQKTEGSTRTTTPAEVFLQFIFGCGVKPAVCTWQSFCRHLGDKGPMSCPLCQEEGASNVPPCHEPNFQFSLVLLSDWRSNSARMQISYLLEATQGACLRSRRRQGRINQWKQSTASKTTERWIKSTTDAISIAEIEESLGCGCVSFLRASLVGCFRVQPDLNLFQDLIPTLYKYVRRLWDFGRTLWDAGGGKHGNKFAGIECVMKGRYFK